MKPRFWPLLVGIAILCGCKNHQVKILQPSNQARTLTPQPASISYEPLRYTFFTQGKRVVMRISNPSDKEVFLLPENSYVVDPWQQTDPIRGESISPGGSVVLNLPPHEPVGVWTPYFPYWQARASADFRIFDTDPDMSSYDWPYNAKANRQDVVTSPYMWRWPSGAVRLHLGYKKDGQTFEHEFVFLRAKPSE